MRHPLDFDSTLGFPGEGPMTGGFAAHHRATLTEGRTHVGETFDVIFGDRAFCTRALKWVRPSLSRAALVDCIAQRRAAEAVPVPNVAPVLGPQPPMPLPMWTLLRPSRLRRPLPLPRLGRAHGRSVRLQSKIRSAPV